MGNFSFAETVLGCAMSDQPTQPASMQIDYGGLIACDGRAGLSDVQSIHWPVVASCERLGGLLTVCRHIVTNPAEILFATARRPSTWRKEQRSPRVSLKLPDLDYSKSAVLNSLPSRNSRRSYEHAIRDFTEWYCPETRLAFNSSVVTRYRIAFGAAEVCALNDKFQARCSSQTCIRSFGLRSS